MLDMAEDPEYHPEHGGADQKPGKNGKSVISWFRSFLTKARSQNTSGNGLEEFIPEVDDEKDQTVSPEERELISNILKLRNINVVNIMVPRAEIVAIEEGISQTELLSLLSQRQVSRLPVYRGTLDEVLGTIHIKDILAVIARGKNIHIPDLITEVPIVSPAMSILDLLWTMQEESRHMALVVDEYGGIDGLVTIGDIIETITGEVEDEHDRQEEEPKIIMQPDGSLVADSRVDIESFEEEYGKLFTSEERDESDTLGGIVCFLAGRVPARGEILKHPSGMVFEVLDADPKRVEMLKVRNIP